ncbi:MAG: hypothetical protein LBG88_04395 [Christensenellaceae bacterium]|jgi:uncharacterized membrane protein|nr:hypothetical protein [Christensenellaceae bacterium]
MNKEQFLKRIKRESGDEALVAYYDELISDRLDAGETETAVIKVLSYEFSKKELEKESTKRGKGKTWIVLGALFVSPWAAPALLGLGIAFIAIFLSFNAAAFSLAISAMAGVVWSLIVAFGLMGTESAGYVLLNVGSVLVASGIVGIIGYFAVKFVLKFNVWLSVKFFGLAKRKKEKVK